MRPNSRQDSYPTTPRVICRGRLQNSFRFLSKFIHNPVSHLLLLFHHYRVSLLYLSYTNWPLRSYDRHCVTCHESVYTGHTAAHGYSNYLLTKPYTDIEWLLPR